MAASWTTLQVLCLVYSFSPTLQVQGFDSNTRARRSTTPGLLRFGVVNEAVPVPLRRVNKMMGFFAIVGQPRMQVVGKSRGCVRLFEISGCQRTVLTDSEQSRYLNQLLTTSAYILSSKHELRTIYTVMFHIQWCVGLERVETALNASSARQPAIHLHLKHYKP